MTHALVGLAALIYWPVQGTGHGWVWTALMLRAVYVSWRDADGGQ